jgi:hypothetical protein
MSADFIIDVRRSMVFSRATDVLTVGDVLDHMERLTSHPDFRPEFNQIFDMREVTRVEMSGEDIKRLATKNIFAPVSRRALLVTPGLQFGLGRIFATYREFAGETGIRILIDEREAHSWVSLIEET